MKKIRILFPLLFLLIGTVSGSCGGGGPIAGGGIGGTGVSASGEITAVGSATVNGVRYETPADTVFIVEPDDNRNINDLAEGMVVLVSGTLNSAVNGTAASVTFTDIMEGPIDEVAESVTGVTKVLTVMGQTVIVEDQVTRLQLPLTFAGLNANSIGQVIEVSGFRRTDDVIKATFIDKKADNIDTFLIGDDLEVEGIIAGLGPDAFTIAGITVDFSTADTSGTLEDGALVEVKGDTLNGTTLTAVSVEVRNQGFPDVERAELEGLITSHTPSPCEFVITGQRVDCSAAAYVGGVITDLAPDVRVEVEGPINGGILLAERVEFRESVRIEANAATVDAVAGYLTLDGLSGITVLADEGFTKFDGGINGIGDINPDNNLRIRGMHTGGAGGGVLAVSIELKNTSPDTRVELQGTVDAFSSPPAQDSVTIVGFLLDTQTFPNLEFRDSGGGLTGRADFFNSLSIGDLVSARADRQNVGDQLEWQQIELER